MSEPDLFFPASDSEDELAVVEKKPTPRTSSSVTGVSVGKSSTAAKGRSSSSSGAYDEDDEIIAIAQPQAGPSSLKRPAPPARSPSSQARIPSSFSDGYLGEFVCEGWSLSKGKGYCTPGSKIVFERPKPAKAQDEGKLPASGNMEKAGPARLVGGKVVNGKGKVAGKQITLGAMMSKKSTPPPPKKTPAKPIVDQIIRFRNERGFEIGRLSVTEAGFLVHLLDTGIISIRGHVIDCPQVLSTGSTILLNVKVFLTREAFEKVEKDGRPQDEGSFWQEQKETTEEEAMRKRKDALGLLFGACILESATRVS
jgi:DNA repair protein RAD5